MQKGRVNRSHIMKVFYMLKPIVCDSFDDHGDIKDLGLQVKQLSDIIFDIRM